MEHHEDDRRSFYGAASRGIATCRPIHILHLMTIEAAFLPVKAPLMAVEVASMPVEAMDHLEHSTKQSMTFTRAISRPVQ